MKKAIKFVALAAFAATLSIACSKDATPSGGGGKEEEKPDQTVKVTGITLDKTFLSLKQGETATLKATVLPADATNKKVHWSSTNPNIYVSDAGEVHAGANVGSTLIVVSTDNGKYSANCTVAVNDKDFTFKKGKLDSIRFYCPTSFRGETANNMMLYYYIPSTVDEKTATVQFVMHGTSRNADDYARYWKTDADTYGLVILAPCYTKTAYPNTLYQYGDVYNNDQGEFNKLGHNTYQTIEDLFDFFRERTGSKVATYNIWGHSAGGQFCHRFAQFAKSPRAKFIVAANPGNYTFPTVKKDYPYGWGNAEQQIGISRADIYARNLILMLGTADTDENDPNLPKTAADNEQGKNRYERGKNFFDFCKNDAKDRNLTFNWVIKEVEGVAHAGGTMGRNAAQYLYGE